MDQPSLTLRLPGWLESLVTQTGHPFTTVEERMGFVIELSRRNMEEKTGGPFGAAVFCMNDGSLLAAGVNMVLSVGNSVLHAEIVAIMAAQRRTGSHDLSAAGLPPYELVASTEPCAMCMGAVTWSGVRRLVCGARGADAEEAGFDEGEKPPSWTDALERRGIAVLRDICRTQAASVLRDYGNSGGVIYNPHRSS